ncbi:MAG TPA: ABC transporter permease [Candidatus Udaeobacter sp.]|nr:ABC transporter permease [Candidatus Udaeobacter sp.]
MTDLKYALRQLVKSPGFTIVAVLTLALAIGSNTAVLSLVNALLLRPLPYNAPNNLVLLWERFPPQGLERIPVSAPEYLDYEKQATSFEKIAAFNYAAYNLTTGDVPERVSGAVVSPSLFPLLGVEPIRGRVFTKDEGAEGRDDVVVISARLWQRRFNSDPTIVGNKISLNGRPNTVVGIMPSHFDFPLAVFNLQGSRFVNRADIWKPVAFTKEELEARYARSYGIIGRLRPGLSVAKAQAQIDNITANFRQTHPKNYPQEAGAFGAKVYGLQDQVVGPMRTGLWILLGAVTLVLLIACANLTTMLLARAASREREMAIRVALGANLKRMLRQLLTESVLLSVLGGTAGVLLSIWAIDLLRAIGAQTVPRLREVNLDLNVLAMTFGVCIVTGILFGIVPALVSAKPELTEALKEGGRGSTSGAHRHRLRNSLIVVETVLALILLASAGLLIKSFVRLQSVSPGFNPHNVLTAEISLPLTKYPRGQPVINFYKEASRRIKNIAGVQHAAFTVVLPLSGSNTDSSFIIEGQDPKATGAFPDEEIRDITPDYFRVLQTPLLKGRFFSEADTADSPPVVMVNQAFTKKYFANEEALGKRISRDDTNPKWATIVGIVADIRHRGLDVEAQPEYYLPHTQGPDREMTLVVRSAQDARTLARSIREELGNIDPDVPLANVRTLDAVVADSVAPRRLSVVLLSAFAAIALLLASVGMYGVISFVVAQRTHEIGVRMALGAQRADVLKMVIAHAAKLLLISAAIGLPLALLCSSALQTLLYRVSPFDLSIFLIVTAILAAVGLFASYLPAVRAARADPLISLGHNA